MYEWINCNDDLPIDGEAVLGYSNLGDIKDDYYITFYLTNKGWLHATNSHETLPKITHWMPLPEYPES